MRYEKVIERVLDVRLHSGDEAYCLCPFHDDSNPSFAINQKTGLWICHGCQERGNFKTLQSRLGIENGEIPISDLIDRIHQLRNPVPYIPNSNYPEEWLKQFDHPTGYWTKRGFRKKLISQFGLGFDPITQYATIPLRNHYGQLLGVIRRATRPDQNPKYYYPKGFARANEFYGSWLVKNHHAVLVEGSLDAIAVWSAGHQGLAIYGSTITHHQIALLNRLAINTVTIITDADPVGRKAREDIISSLHGFIIKVPTYWPNGAKDPMDIPPHELIRTIETARHIWDID